MNKNILIGTAAFGGLLLVVSLIFSGDKTVQQDVTVSGVEQPTSVSLPEFVSSVFPIYPQTTLLSVRESEGESSIDASISLSTEDAIVEINEWYREALSQNGWSIKSDKNVGGYQIIQGEKDNLYTSMQAANDGNGGATISQHAKVRQN